MNRKICIELEKTINDYFKSLGYLPNMKISSLKHEFNFCLCGIGLDKIFIYSKAFVGEHPNGKIFSIEEIENMREDDFIKYIFEHIKPILDENNIPYNDVIFPFKDIVNNISLSDYLKIKND